MVSRAAKLGYDFYWILLLLLSPAMIIIIVALSPAESVHAQENANNVTSISISGSVYEDLNRNGTFDYAQETGIAEVFLAVMDGNGTVMDEAISLVNGSYWFDNLEISSNATIYLTLLIPPGYNATEPEMSPEDRLANPQYVYYFSNDG